MITDRTTSAQSQQSVVPAEYSSGMTADDFESRYVIQRTSETIREWWTGTDWSDDLEKAMRYDHKPDVSIETLDEMAKAVRINEIDD